jgi:enoyl-CoA hydratase/carnithine racemase
VILSGEGSAFCAGLDVKSVTQNPMNAVKLLERPVGKIANLAQQVAWGWRQLPVPVIAVLHGVCFGGGLQIALGADFRFTTPDCKISIMEAKVMTCAVTGREPFR